MNFNALTEYLDSIEKQYGIPYCDCAVTYRHNTVFRHMTGRYDAAGSKPTNISVLYRLFSGTKIATCVCAMQLVERGKLGLYDELSKYLPEFSVMKVADNFDYHVVPTVWPQIGDPCHIAHRSIRIIDLLTMSAGFTYDTSAQSVVELSKATGRKASTRDCIRALTKMPLMYEPGGHWAYSLAHDVLAAVIEVVSGRRYSDYLRENIFAPLGDEDFCFHPDASMAQRLGHLYSKDRITGAIGDDDGVYSGSFSFTDEYESGGAGLITTVSAYSKLIDALSCGGTAYNGARILSPETVELFATPYTSGATQEDFTFFRRKRIDYAYGLGVRVRVNEADGRSPLGEFGWDGAAGSYFLVDPKNGLGIVYAQHVMGCIEAFDNIHPTVRDLVYEAMEL